MSIEPKALAVRGEPGPLRRLARWLGAWEPSEDRTPLVRYAQVGVLPTMRFWLRRDVRHVLVPTYVAGLATAIVLASMLGAPPILGGLLGATVPLLGIGVLERYVRRVVRRRGHMLVAASGR